MAFQVGAFQQGAFQQTGTPVPPSPSSGGGRWVRHFGAQPYERIEPQKPEPPRKKRKKELEALQAEARELGIRAETVAALADAAQLLKVVLDRREILKRIAEEQLDEEEAIGLILASIL